MKYLRVTIVIISLFTVGFADVLLNGTWLFNIGDDSSWASIEFNDSAWYPITVPAAWENQGFANYDGIAWYRHKFKININKLAGDSLFLYLGKTNDAILPFINGMALCPSPRAFDSTKTVFYKFPKNILLANNILAIQFNNHDGPGGILSGPVKISTTAPLPKSEKHDYSPKQSWSRLPFSNGLVVATYDTKIREFSGFSPHIYSQISARESVPIIASSARTILFKNRREIDLTNLQTKSAGYIEGTGIVHHSMAGKDFILDQYAFAPFTLDKPFWIFYAVLSGNSLENYSLNFVINDVDPSLSVGKWSFQEGNRKWLLVVCSYDEIAPTKSFNSILKYKNENPGFSALISEIEWWKNWQKTTVLPPNISTAEATIYIQSLAILKMAQCRERFPARGQIVHSFPPNKMAVTTLAGMGFSIDAFLKSGHEEEALAALQFIFNGRCGYLKHYSGAGEAQGIGQDYSVTSNYYFGDGTEATETNEFGPVIYFGNFGITLWNLKQYIETTGDVRFLEYYWPKISTEIADVLVGNIDKTGLIRADNGFFNAGVPKHYFYSSVCACRGLVDAVWLARMVNDEARASTYENIAITLRQHIETCFSDEDLNAIKSFLEGNEIAIDAVTALGLLWVYTPQDYISKGTLAIFEKNLAAGNGFSRFPKNKNKPAREWLFGNILITSLNQHMTNFNKAKNLQNWIVGQALNNYGLIPEYYSPGSDYSGTVPLCGLGAGMYISSFWGE